MKTTICCIAKNEDRYIHEWIAYHLKLGFDKIYIYCHDWVCSVINSDKVSTINLPSGTKSPQMPIYNLFLNTSGREYDWVMFLDVDEFLVLKKHNTVQEFLKGRTESFGVNWVLFGDNFLDDDGSDGVLRRFTKCQNKPNKHVKCFVKTGCPSEMETPHNPHGQWRGSDGKLHTYAFCINGNTDEAQINHYFCKTRQEWKLKQARGCADSDFIRPDSDFDRHNFNEIDDFLARDFFIQNDLINL